MEIVIILLCTAAIMGSHLFFIAEYKNLINLLYKILEEIEELKKE